MKKELGNDDFCFDMPGSEREMQSYEKNTKTESGKLYKNAL